MPNMRGHHGFKGEPVKPKIKMPAKRYVVNKSVIKQLQARDIIYRRKKVDLPSHPTWKHGAPLSPGAARKAGTTMSPKAEHQRPNEPKSFNDIDSMINQMNIGQNLRQPQE